MTHPLTILQRLSVEWRVGLPASLLQVRRALPKWVALPGSVLSRDALGAGVLTLAHNVEWSDADAFAQARETVLGYGPGSPPPHAEVQITPTHHSQNAQPEGLELLPTPATGRPGWAHLNLRVGQSARLEWNERLTAPDIRYRHTIINIALVNMPIRADLFARHPDFYLSHTVDLNERRSKNRAV